MSRDQLLALLDQAPAVTYIAEAVPDYATLFISSGVRQRLGYEPARFVECPNLWASLIHPEDRDRVFTEISRLSERKSIVVDYRFQHANGSWYWLCDEARFVSNGAAEGGYVVGAILDVTDRVAIKDELRETRNRFETIVDQSLQSIIIHQDWKPVYVNSALVDLLGYPSRDEVLALGSMERIYAPYEHARLRDYQRARRAGDEAPSTYELDVVRKDGTTVSLETYVRKIQWRGRVATQHQMVDITDRKRAQRALRNSEQMLRLITDNLPVAIGLMDKDSRILFLNYQAKLWNEVKDHDYVGKHISQIIGDEAYKEMQPTIARVLTGERMELEQTRVFKNKVTRKVQLIYVPHVDSQGKIVGYLGAGLDVSERRRIEAQIRTSRENLRRLLRRIDGIREEERRQIGMEIHDDIGQKLTALKIVVSQLFERGKWSAADGGNVFELISELFRATKHLSARMRPYVLENLGLEDALREHLKEVTGQANLKHRLHFQIPWRRLPEDYELAIFRIVQEALTNVLRHAGATRVDVSLRFWLRGVLLEVIDNGKSVTGKIAFSGAGVGLIGIRERAGGFGGTARIVPRKPFGTAVRVWLPAPAEENRGNR